MALATFWPLFMVLLMAVPAAGADADPTTCSDTRIPFGNYEIRAEPSRELSPGIIRVERIKLCDDAIRELPFVKNQYDFAYVLYSQVRPERLLTYQQDHLNRISDIKSSFRKGCFYDGIQEYSRKNDYDYYISDSQGSPMLFNRPVLIHCGPFVASYFGGRAPGRSCLLHQYSGFDFKIEVRFLDFNWPISRWRQLFAEIEETTRHTICCLPEFNKSIGK